MVHREVAKHAGGLWALWKLGKVRPLLINSYWGNPLLTALSASTCLGSCVTALAIYAPFPHTWSLSRNKVQLCRQSPNDLVELWRLYLLMIWCNWSGVKSSNILFYSCCPSWISQGSSLFLIFCAYSGLDVSWVIPHITIGLMFQNARLHGPQT